MRLISLPGLLQRVGSTFGDGREGFSLEFFERQSGLESFRFGYCSAGEATQEEVEQSLTGCGIVEGVPHGSRSSRLQDEVVKAG